MNIEYLYLPVQLQKNNVITDYTDNIKVIILFEVGITFMGQATILYKRLLSNIIVDT